MVIEQSGRHIGELVTSVLVGALLLALLAGMLVALDTFLIQSLARAMTLY